MNRYVIDGIKADLFDGKRVGVIAGTLVGSRAIFHDVAEAIGGDAKRITRASGNERIYMANGGELRLYALNRSSLRGEIPDVIVILSRDSIAPDRLSNLLDELAPIRATNPNLEVIAN
jgi:hypothetical protein